MIIDNDLAIGYMLYLMSVGMCAYEDDALAHLLDGAEPLFYLDEESDLVMIGAKNFANTKKVKKWN